MRHRNELRKFAYGKICPGEDAHVSIRRTEAMTMSPRFSRRDFTKFSLAASAAMLAGVRGAVAATPKGEPIDRAFRHRFW